MKVQCTHAHSDTALRARSGATAGLCCGSELLSVLLVVVVVKVAREDEGWAVCKVVAEVEGGGWVLGGAERGWVLGLPELVVGGSEGVCRVVLGWRFDCELD